MIMKTLLALGIVAAATLGAAAADRAPIVQTCLLYTSDAADE